MPQWAGSSWYYLRYEDPKNKKTLVDKKKEKYWSPVDLYVGGAEHATRHLIYARFWHKFLFDIGVVNYSEPFTRLQNVGLILAEGGEKMSKSKGNVVNPDSLVEKVGADALRLYEMFMGPFEQAVMWSTDGIVGPRRFLERVWKLADKVDGAHLRKPRFVFVPKSREASFDAPYKLSSSLQKTIIKVSGDIEAMQFNTAVSALMIFSNELEKEASISKEIYETLLKLLFPFVPHIAEELWNILGHKKSISLEVWPVAEKSKIIDENVVIAVQINGKVRAELSVATNMAEKEIENMAINLPNVLKWTEGQEIKKVVYVKGRVVNIVAVPRA